jgi:hypothetical protein
MKSSAQFCDLCGLPLRRHTFTLSSFENTYQFCCNGCKQVYLMLVEQHGAGDPGSFRDSELFKKCLELGIIPKSEEDLRLKEAGPSVARKTKSWKSREQAIHLNLKLRGMWCPACAWVIEESENPGFLTWFAAFLRIACGATMTLF